MSAPVITARGLGKDFRVYAKPGDRLLELLTGRRRHQQFRALGEVDLQIHGGETVGIVGRNGSGKSTLLQLIAGVLQPTRGSVAVQGRVAALLELGSGFSPDFSGRENVMLNAQVMGLRRSEVEARFDRIERFADIGSFIDQPVRTYSSGMLVRLAFAVAINADPDVLIIDEALAVGDEAFQRKCFARIEEIRDAGATILFVSHSAASVVNLCDRAVLLDEGELLMTGRPKDVVARYQRLVHAPLDQREALREEIRAWKPDWDSERETEAAAAAGAEAPPATRPAGGHDAAEIREWPMEAQERFEPGLVPESTVDFVPSGARIRDVQVFTADNRQVNVLVPGEAYVLRYRVRFDREAQAVEMGMAIKSVDGITLFGQSSHGQSGFLASVAAGTEIEVEFRFLTRLRPGTYFLNVGCQGLDAGSRERVFLHRILDAGCFRIEGTPTDRYKVGYFDLSDEPACRWRTLPD